MRVLRRPTDGQSAPHRGTSTRTAYKSTHAISLRCAQPRAREQNSAAIRDVVNARGWLCHPFRCGAPTSLRLRHATVAPCRFLAGTCVLGHRGKYLRAGLQLLRLRLPLEFLRYAAKQRRRRVRTDTILVRRHERCSARSNRLHNQHLAWYSSLVLQPAAHRQYCYDTHPTPRSA